MSGKYLLGAAAVALVAATSGARAADFTPIAVVAPAVAPVVVAPAGPIFAIEIEKVLDLDLDFDPLEVELGTGIAATVEMRTLSGWGFRFVMEGGADLGLPIQGGALLGTQVFRTIGNAEVGVFATTSAGIPFMGFGGFSVGPYVTYQAGRLTAAAAGGFQFGMGGFQVLIVDAEVTVDVTERVAVTGGVNFGVDGGGITGYQFDGELRLNLGAITPYVGGTWSPGFWSFVAGAEFEHQIGSRSIWLIGGGQYGYFSGGSHDFDAYVGLRFRRGEPTNPFRFLGGGPV